MLRTDISKSAVPERGFMRLATILQIIPVSKSTWWAGVKTKRFPSPVKLGPHITAWRVEDIQRLIEETNSKAGSNSAQR